MFEEWDDVEVVLTTVGKTYGLRLWARRLASSKRLVVVAPGSAGSLAGGVGAAAGVWTVGPSSAGTPGNGSVTGLVGRNKSALGSVAAAVWVERTESLRASSAARDSSDSGARGTPCQKKTFL